MLYTAKISAGVNLEFAVRDHREVARECLTYVEKFRDEFFLPSWRRRQALVERFHAGEIPREALPVDLLTLMLLHREHFAAYGEEAPLREAMLFNGASGGVTIAACNTLTHLLAWVGMDAAARRPLLDDPGFLRRAAFEAMRMRPATPFQIRKTIRTTTLSSGRTVAEGEFIALAMAEASRDRTVFGEDADTYDPMRKPVGRVKPAGLAFGEGPHTCIAMSLSVGDANSDDEERHGLLISLLSQLLRRDVRIETGDGVKRQDGTIRAEFDAFTVTLAAPPAAASAR
jgi:cytochrome P450